MHFRLAAAALLVPASIAAQTVVVVPPPAPTVPPGALAVTLPEGTEFVARTKTAISSKTSATGDEVPMEVSQDVNVNGYTVIRAGTLVRASVSDVHRAGRMGRGGALSIHLEATFAADQQRVRLRSAKSTEGNNATGSTVALTVLFGPLGLLKRGHEAEYPAGTPVTVYTDAPVTVLFAQQAAPTVVQQTAAPVVVQQAQPAPAPAPQPAPPAPQPAPAPAHP